MSTPRVQPARPGGGGPAHLAPAARRGRRSWPQRLLLAFNCVFVALLLTTAGGLAYAYSKYSRLPRVQLGAALEDRSGGAEPRNVLIVGTDSAAGLDPDDPIRSQREDLGIHGLRADTLMVLRVDPGQERAALLSVPRDLWVPLASGGHQRISAAVQVGGIEELVRTVSQHLGIPVNHYIQVDFAGFQDLVEAIGGVPVYFPTPARDRESGLVVPDPGCVRLDGRQALAYVRSRALQTFEGGRWKTDPTGDLGRVSRQQDFIRRALRQAVDSGARNPVRLDELIDIGLASVVVDDLLTAQDILDLGRRFRAFNPDNLDLFALPVREATVGGAAVVRMVDAQARPLLDRFVDPDAHQERPAGVLVRVLNGTGRAGEARMALDALAAAGFGRAGVGEAERFGFDRTVVRYASGQRAGAELVARWLVAGAELEQHPAEAHGADVVLVTGADFAGVRAAPLPPPPPADPPITVAPPPVAPPDRDAPPC